MEGAILPEQEDYYAVDVVDAEHAWIVGTYGTALVLTEGGRTAKLHPVPVREPFFCISFRDPENGVIGGRGGRIFRTTDGGRSWEPGTGARVQENLLAVARGADRSRIWMVGPRGTVLRSVDDGATWEDRSLGQDVTLNSVSFLGDQEGWVVGEFGTILYTPDGGDTWLRRNEHVEGLPPYVEDVSEEIALRVGIPPLTKDDLYLFDVVFPSPDTGYVVAAGGFVLSTRDRGMHWTAERAATRNTLFDIVATPAGRLIASGVLGTLVRRSQDGWVRDEELSHRLFTWIRAVGFSPDGTLGVAVGGKGTILLSRDGGSTWERVSDNVLRAAVGRGLPEPTR